MATSRGQNPRLDGIVAYTVTVRSSKTDQEGKGSVQFVGASTVARVRAWLDAAFLCDEEPDAPLFQRLSRGGRPLGKLSCRSVREVIRKRANDAGVEGRVSGHSLRVGCCTIPCRRGRVYRGNANRWTVEISQHARALCPRSACPKRGRCKAKVWGVMRSVRLRTYPLQSSNRAQG